MSEPLTGLNCAGATGTSACISGDSVQNKNLDVSTSITTQRMPKPGERNAPTFDPEKPEGLVRFFERIEDWFIEETIEDDIERKRCIVKYLDADSEMQWKALPKFEAGTFNEFKAQVMSSYPTAEEALIGLLSALKRKTTELGKIAIGDQDMLANLIRVMNAEILKLDQVSPPIHTNRELVELFLSRLVLDFAIKVATNLSMQSLLNTKHLAFNSVEARDPEDLYCIEDVMEMARHTSLEYASPIGKFLLNNPTEDIPETDTTLEEAIAHLTDSINLQAHHNELVDQRLDSLQSSMNQFQLRAVTEPETEKVQSDLEVIKPLYNYVHSAASAAHSRNCYYCESSGHRILGCEHALKHLDLGWIKRVGNRFRLPDGSQIPRYGDMSMKLIVERLGSMCLDMNPRHNI